MGTVTAIGEYDPDRRWWGHDVTTTSGTTISASSLTTTSPSVSFGDWDAAVKFAEVIAKQHRGVKVRKVDGQWSVQWIDYGPVLINPVYPNYPAAPWQSPYITYTSRSA